MILVTGATGNIGGEVARQLARAGFPTRALVRDLAKAAALQKEGIELAQGSFDQPESLALALQGVEKAFLLIADDPHHLEFLDNFIKAAQKAKVQHLVVLSGEGAAENSPRLFSRWHWQREQGVKAANIPFTFIKPVYIMQNFLSYRTAIVQQSRFFAPISPEYQLSMVEGRDIAAVAVTALTQQGHLGKEYVVTGSQKLSFSEAASTLSKVLGKTVGFVQIPLEVFEKQLLDAGQPQWLVEAVANILQAPATLVTDTVATVTGRSPFSFEQFLEANKAAFQAS